MGTLSRKNGTSSSSDCELEGSGNASGAIVNTSSSSFLHSCEASNAAMKFPSGPDHGATVGDVSSSRHRIASGGEKYGSSTDAFAGAVSSSVANSAAAGHEPRRLAHTAASQNINHNRESDGTSSNDGTTPAARVSSSSGTAQTSSSGDDRDSSEGMEPSSSFVKALLHSATSQEVERVPSTNQEGEDRPHYHRHRRHSVQPTEGAVVDSPQQGSVRLSSMASPAPANHATVVAHLPPLGGSIDSTAAGYWSSGGGWETDRAASLLLPYREPCFHTIRQTFTKFAKRAARKSPKRDDSLNHQRDADMPVHRRAKRVTRRQASDTVIAALSPSNEAPMTSSSLKQCRCFDGSYFMEEEGYAGSSGSGSEGGYMGSNSSNGNLAQDDSCSSPSSEDSSEDSGTERRPFKGQTSGGPLRQMLSKKRESGLSSTSSEIADFSSDTSYIMRAFKMRSESSEISSSSILGSNDDEPLNDQSRVVKQESRKRGASASRWPAMSWQASASIVKSEGDANDGRRKKRRVHIVERKLAAVGLLQTDAPTLQGKPPIMVLGCEIMAHVLTFLEPPDILDVLTMPLSKDWLSTFTRQPELWRVLCLLEPFKAQLDDDDVSDCCSSDDDSVSSLPFDSGLTAMRSKFRLFYTSYIRCMRCLIRIKDDAVNKRPLSVVDHAAVVGDGAGTYTIGANRNLQQFLSRARGCVTPNAALSVRHVVNDSRTTEFVTKKEVNQPDTTARRTKKKNVKLGLSKMTHILLGPTLFGKVGEVELPWSYGIYSIVNWMVAFSNVEGIQTMCLRVLPFLLENEQQRITAQKAGLTDIVLRDMILFPESPILHTAAFHTIVLLARPFGGQEGMLFHTSMVNASGIFSSAVEREGPGKSGIAVLLDSMRRFHSDEVLQSMSCWSLVNIALDPVQKEMLVKLGGIEVIARAMLEHPYNAEVQFRANFALINLVIPSVNGVNDEGSKQVFALRGIDPSEKEMLDETVDQIINLVVLAMKNFCSNEAILNRACLVLHNLSLTTSYHSAMLGTPDCYQMLEWCLGNYQTDQVLQQSAAGTLYRLQMTLSSDKILRSRFTASIQAQQKYSLEQAHREAVRIHEQQEERAAQVSQLCGW